MGVASSRFHRPYVHFTYNIIDIRGALTLAQLHVVGVRSRSFVTPLITRINARLLFEGGSYFFELTKSASTIRGLLLFK